MNQGLPCTSVRCCDPLEVGGALRESTATRLPTWFAPRAGFLTRILRGKKETTGLDFPPNPKLKVPKMENATMQVAAEPEGKRPLGKKTKPQMGQPYRHPGWWHQQRQEVPQVRRWRVRVQLGQADHLPGPRRRQLLLQMLLQQMSAH